MHDDDLLVRKKRLVYITRSLVALAVVSLASFGSLGFYSLASDNHRYRDENQSLRDQVSQQGSEQECRSAAATAQSAALADLQVATSEAAEYAFRRGEIGDPEAIAAHLERARENVRKTTAARDRAQDECDIADFQGVATEVGPSSFPDPMCPDVAAFLRC